MSQNRLGQFGERDLNQYVLKSMTAFGGYFRERLKAGKQSGELPKDFDENVAAQTLVTYLLGLFRVIGVLHDRAAVERQIKALLRGLGL